MAEKKKLWQEEKSEITRATIMNAAIDCYIEYGYSNTTVTKISDKAKVSRGALMHHFSSREDIIKNSLTFLIERRSQEFDSLVQEIRQTAGSEVSEDSLTVTVNSMWKFFHMPSYTAFFELLIAARTDQEFSKYMAPAQVNFDERIKNSIHDTFPAWNDIESSREVITDLLFYTLQGLAVSTVMNRRQPRVKNLLDLLVRETLEEYNRAIERAK